MTDHPDSVRTATNRQITAVVGDREDLTGATNATSGFASWAAFGATPTYYVPLTCTQPGVAITKFSLEEVRYYLDCIGSTGSTYEIFFFEAARADDVGNAGDLVLDTGSAQAEATKYQWGPTGHATTANYQLPVIVSLTDSNKLYFIITWSATPTTSVMGYIKIRGKLLK
jgi:hypothetical protein